MKRRAKPNDGALQRDVAKASLEIADQLTRLNDLLGYRDPEDGANGNGKNGDRP